MRGQGFENAAALLPGDIRAAALALDAASRGRAEEFRLRAGAPATVLLPEGEREFTGRAVNARDLDSALENATRASAHTALENVASGFITVRGGVRVGLCGVVSESAGRVLTIRRLTSMSLRIPRQATGCADLLWGELTAGGFKDTLLLSPPGGGKTTLLRELVRRLSDVYRVSLLDERGEVAGVFDAVPEFDVGRRTDVLTGVDKRRGTDMLLRAMNPQVLAMDEITSPEDVEAVKAAAGCGVVLLATAHAPSPEEMLRRPVYRSLLGLGVFRRAVQIDCRLGVRSYTIKEIAP